MGSPSGFDDIPSATAIQPDGRIVVIGTTRGRQSYGLVVRFRDDGSPDATFGIGGSVLLSPPRGRAWIEPETVDVMPDGRILVASSLDNDLSLTRLTSGGALDPTFGTAGSIVINDSRINSRFQLAAGIRVAVQADGKLLVMTDATEPSPLQQRSLLLRFRRLLANGEVDSSFGNGGTRLLSGVPGNFGFFLSQLAAAEPSGGFVLVATQNSYSSSQPYAIVRVNPRGELDTSFGKGGSISGIDLGYPRDTPYSLSRSGNGNYVFAGNGVSSANVTSGVIWRVDSEGKLSKDFGTGGRMVLDNAASGGVVAVLPDGAVAVAGHPPNAYTSLLLSVYDTNGTLRKSSGTGGSLTRDFSGYLVVRPMSVISDARGRITVIGAGFSKIADWGPDVISSFTGYDILLMGGSETGAQRTGFGRGDGTAVWNNPALSNDSIDRILIDSLGRISLIGYTGFPAFAPLDTYLTTRLNADGTLNTGFGVDGRSTFGPLEMDGQKSFAVMQVSGSVVVVNRPRMFLNGARVPTMYSVDSSGAVDTRAAFPVAGQVMALQSRPDHRIVAMSLIATSTARSFALQQFMPDSSVDATFGTNGTATVVLPEASYAGDMALLPDGSLVTAAFYGSTVRLDKLNARGERVATFGNAGTQSSTTTEVAYLAWSPRLIVLADGTLMTVALANKTTSTGAWSLFTQSVRFAADGTEISSLRLPMYAYTSEFATIALRDGSALISGVDTQGIATLVRVLPNGKTDEAFGGDAGVATNLQSITALALDAIGRLIIVGQDETSTVVSRYRLETIAVSGPVFEYFNSLNGHYFYTADIEEAAQIDRGGAGPGWTRYAEAFRTWPRASFVPIDAVPVCRFYGTPGVGPNSHFYSAAADECVRVATDRGWTAEGIAFYAKGTKKGACPQSSTRVYRAYNGGAVRNDTNHRYSTDLSVLQRMPGWIVEGLVFCVSL